MPLEIAIGMLCYETCPTIRVSLATPLTPSSQATNDAEKKHSPTKLEKAVIIFALNHFEVYLLGTDIDRYYKLEQVSLEFYMSLILWSLTIQYIRRRI